VLLERPEGLTQWTFEHAGGSYAVFVVDDEFYVTDGAARTTAGRSPRGWYGTAS